MRKLLFIMLASCLALVGSAWAGTIEFTGADVNGQGALSFTPGVGDTLIIGPGGGGSGALIQTLLDTVGLCAPAGCSVTTGYMTLTSGLETGGGCTPPSCSYNFGAGGTLDVFGTVTTSLGTSSGHLFHATFTGGAFGVNGTVGTYAGALSIPSITFFGPAFGSYKFTGGAGNAITISLNSGCQTGGACNGLVDQASASVQTQAIPEPATLSIMGAALLGLGTGIRRKLSRI